MLSVVLVVFFVVKLKRLNCNIFVGLNNYFLESMFVVVEIGGWEMDIVLGYLIWMV